MKKSHKALLKEAFEVLRSNFMFGPARTSFVYLCVKLSGSLCSMSSCWLRSLVWERLQADKRNKDKIFVCIHL